MRCLVTTLLLIGTVASAGAMLLAPAPVDDQVTLVALRGRRPVPDVAYPADIMYPVFVAGRGIVVGGTSASALAWAGTVALLNQSLGVPAGFLNAALYQLGRAQADGGAMAFHDVVSGSNGFDVGPGHDLATGWGTPNGAAFFDAYPTP